MPKAVNRYIKSVTVWGLPAAHEHDAQRGVTCGEGKVKSRRYAATNSVRPQEAHIPIEAVLVESDEL